MERLKIINLEGTDKEIGLQHGQALRDDIFEMMDRAFYVLQKSVKKRKKDIVRELIDESEYIEYIKQKTPGLYKEVEGIAQGADVDFEELLAYQCLEEIWMVLPYDNLLLGHKCTSLGVGKTSDHPTFIGQNLDWLDIYDGFDVLLKIHNTRTKLKTLVASNPGFIGMNGMNNSPLAVCVNSLESDLKGDLKGLPVAFMIRNLLETTSVDSAVELLTRTKHSSAENYLIGDKDKIVDYECSSNKKVEYRPFPNRVFHTNHAIVNDDFHLPLLNPSYIRANTYDRLEYVQYRMDPSKPFTLQTAKYLLSSSFGPIDIQRKGINIGGMTIFSSIFLLSEKPELHLAPGNPSRYAYKVYKFDF